MTDGERERATLEHLLERCTMVEREIREMRMAVRKRMRVTVSVNREEQTCEQLQ